MACYGVPSTVLNVKEYGGPVKDKTTYKTFSYDKSSLALYGSSSDSGYFLKTGFSSSFTENLNSEAKTVTFRIKPERSDQQYHLFSLSGSGQNPTRPGWDNHLVLTPYAGSDISSSGDYVKYGKLDVYLTGSVVASTANFPIYNGDFWNIFMGREKDNDTTYGTVRFVAYQSNHLKSITKKSIFIFQTIQSQNILINLNN